MSFEAFNTIANTRSVADIRKYIDRNEEFFNDYVRRRRAKRILIHHGIPVEPLLPNRSKLIGNRVMDTVSNIIKGGDVDDELEYIRNISKTSNAANVTISNIKKELIHRGYNQRARDIETSIVKDDIVNETIREREKATEDNAEKQVYIHEFFSMRNVLARLRGYVEDLTNLEITNTVIADALINFSARPAELYGLILRRGNVEGQLKDRGHASSNKYIGLLPYDDAAALLEAIKSAAGMNPADVKISVRFRTYMKRYDMLPSLLRKVGAHYASVGEPNKIKRLRKRQLALRHKDMTTSLLHYDIADRIM